MGENKNTNIFGKEDADINVLMLGKSGVGKTTVLSLLYYDLHKKIKPFDFEYKCEKPSDKAELESFLRSLRSPITGEVNDRLSSDGDGGHYRDDDIKLDGTLSKRTYRCSVSRDGKKLGNITFCDIVGGDVENLDVTNESALEEFKELFKAADIFILPLNTPSIMDGDDDTPEEFNSFNRIGTLLAQIDKGLFKNKPFIFVPIRCEEYSDSFEAVIEKVRSNIAGFSDQIRGYYSIFPVVTLGGLHTTIEKDAYGKPVKEVNGDTATTKLRESVRVNKVHHKYTEKRATLIALYWAEKYCKTQFKDKKEPMTTDENYKQLEFIKRSKQKKLKDFKEEIWRWLKKEYHMLSPFISDYATGDKDVHTPSFMEDARNTYYKFKSNP